MTVRPVRVALSPLSAVLLAVLAAILAACSPPPAPLTLPSIPPLDRLDAPVKTQFENAHDRASQALHGGNRTEIAESAGRLGMLFHAYQYPEPALVAYDLARGQQPMEPRWQYLYSLIARQLGEFEEARQALLNAHRPGANTSFIELRLGELELEQGNLERATDWFDRASVDPIVESRALTGLGLAHLEAGRTEQAIQQLTRALSADPSDATARHALGNAYRAQGDAGQAARYLRGVPPGSGVAAAFDGDPFMADVLELRQGHKHFDELAAQALTEGKIGLALAHYQRALDANPAALDVRHNYAILLWRQGTREQSQEQFAAIFAERPDYVPSHLFLGYELGVAGDLDLAEQHIRAAVAADPQNAKAAALLADFLDFGQRHEEALQAYRRLRELDPDMEKAWIGVVYSLVETGQVDEALVAIDSGLRRLPGNGALIQIRRDIQGLAKNENRNE